MIMKSKPKAKKSRETWEPVVYKPLRAMAALPVEVDLITALQRINERICAATELDDLLAGACEEIGRILRVDRVHLALASGQRNVFGRVGYEWISSVAIPATLGAELPSEEDDEVMMDLVATPPPLAVVDPLGDPELPEGPRAVFNAMGVQSAIAGRLQYQGKTLGVLCAHQCDRPRQWTSQEATFMSVVLSQLSVAVANARMIKSLQAQHQELVSLAFRLEESHTGLERLVAERTAELREKNAALAAMVSELKQVDQLKSQFLDTVSHELRTPINFITGFGSLLADGAYGELSGPAAGAVHKVLEGADRLLHLVDDLLDQTKLERGHLQIEAVPFSLPELTERLAVEFGPLMAAKRQVFDVEVDPATPVIRNDPDRVHQVLRNLLSNAHKFTPEGGIVRLVVGPTMGGVLATVDDSGIGIPEAAQQQIFDRFYQVDNTRTRHFGGTGLGLAIVKGLLDAMGGGITVESEPGQGARFRVFLPYEVPASGVLG
jgi:signal transduction histidine kinase